MQILNAHLQSPLQIRCSSSILIFTGSAVEGLDYVPPPHSFTLTHIHVQTYASVPGCRRYIPTKNMYGYRERVEVRLLNVDPHVHTQIFGITRTGAIPNDTYANARNVWHNTVAITEHINRPRMPKDYHYVIANPDHSGANQPTSYTTRMKALECVGLTSSAFKLYEDAYKKIQELRDVFAKQLALDQRIERMENEMKIKESLQKKQIQRELQLALEKRLKKLTKSEKGWEKRFLSSQLIEIQGNWERRRDTRSGLVFFHHLVPNNNPSGKERYMDTCQWEVPAIWDGTSLWTDQDPAVFQRGLAPSIRGAQSTIASVTDTFVYDKAKTEAPASWTPYAGNNATVKNNNTNSVNMMPQGMVMLSDGDAYQRRKEEKTEKQNERRDSISSDLSSILADKSLAPSLAPTIDTPNLQHIAEQLLSSDELMIILAKRLGLSEQQVVKAEDLSSVFSVKGKRDDTSVHENLAREDGGIYAPRDKYSTELYEPEYDSDDDIWSDGEEEVGDTDWQKEIANDSLPQDYLQSTQLHRREMKELRGDLTKPKKKAGSDDADPTYIPPLDLAPIPTASNKNEQHEAERYGWRRLPRPAISSGFLSNALKTHTLPPADGAVNTINSPVYLLPISPVDACLYVPEKTQHNIDVIFIPRAKQDMERSVALLQRNIKREQELNRHVASQQDTLLNGSAKEFTSVEDFLNSQYKAEKKVVSDAKESAVEKAIMAAKASNIAEMEDALAEDIPVNTADSHGNTLLILAAQQGSKRMCKFLLRRGANINMQNLVGNTVLHYCYAYSQIQLAEYLKKKGADDSILNIDGLTCYEGLNKDDMFKVYGDYDQQDYDDAADNDDDDDEDDGGAGFAGGGVLAEASLMESTIATNEYGGVYDKYVSSK